MGLPADLRLRRGQDITRAVRRGRRVRAGGLVLHCLRRPEDDVEGQGAGLDADADADAGRSGGQGRPARGPRVAFVAPRTTGPAVRRNRTRRRVQEQLRTMVAGGTLTAEVDLVVRLHPEATAAGSGELAGWLSSGLRRLGVLT